MATAAQPEVVELERAPVARPRSLHAVRPVLEKCVVVSRKGTSSDRWDPIPKIFTSTFPLLEGWCLRHLSFSYPAPYIFARTTLKHGQRPCIPHTFVAYLLRSGQCRVTMESLFLTLLVRRTDLGCETVPRGFSEGKGHPIAS